MLEKIEPIRAASPWHEGELAIQRSLGVVDRMDAPGRNFVRTFMPEQHQQFYPLLPFIVLGAVDPAGDVWASLRAGEPGFMQAPDAHALDVRLPRDPYDPADKGMGDGAAVAMLGIQLETRRRNRLNGTIRRTSGRSLCCRRRSELRQLSAIYPAAGFFIHAGTERSTKGAPRSPRQSRCARERNHRQRRHILRCLLCRPRQWRASGRRLASRWQDRLCPRQRGWRADDP